MSVLIKGMELPKSPGEYALRLYIDSDCTAMVEGAYGCFEGEPFEAIPVPPHGRLIDADEFLKRAIGTKCFHGDYALMLEELVGESTTIIPTEPCKERGE